MCNIYTPTNVRLIKLLGVQAWTFEEETKNEACAQGLAIESIRALGDENIASRMTGVYAPEDRGMEMIRSRQGSALTGVNLDASNLRKQIEESIYDFISKGQ